jgi:hypothetical protein
LGGMASAWLYALRADFTANAIVSSTLFVAAALMLWRITRIEAAMPAPVAAHEAGKP